MNVKRVFEPCMHTLEFFGIPPEPSFFGGNFTVSLGKLDKKEGKNTKYRGCYQRMQINVFPNQFTHCEIYGER